MEIEQRYAIAFMHRGGMPANKIQEKLTETYGSAAYKIGSVTYWIRQIKLGRINLHEELPREKPIDEGITNAVKRMIEQNPFLSARQIAKVLGISPNTVIDRLVNYLEYRNYHTRWVPHHLSIDQKQIRVECAKSMLTILRNEKRTHFSNVITGDESWFLFEYCQSSQWVLSKEDLIEKTRKTNMEKKIMLTIFFNGSGPVVVNFLPPKLKFNGQYFIDILEEIKMNVYPNGRAQRNVRKILHFDNCPSHRSQKVKDYIENSEFRKMPHPAYSPDVAPSDFGLFGTMKEKLIGVEHDSEESLKSHILEILGDFEPDFWQSLFNSWIERLEELIKRDGNYIE